VGDECAESGRAPDGDEANRIAGGESSRRPRERLMRFLFRSTTIL
jgi:hypothetical protein